MKTAAIGIRATPAELAAWRAAAKADGRSLSAWIARRCAGLEATKPALPEPGDNRATKDGAIR